jgi:hypothetical protein
MGLPFPPDIQEPVHSFAKNRINKGGRKNEKKEIIYGFVVVSSDRFVGILGLGCRGFYDETHQHRRAFRRRRSG